MTARWWYLRRAVPWAVLLGCCAAAGLVGVLLDRWPSSALFLLPALLACCAAAAGFCFDEATLPVVEVTPRGATWRRAARLAVATVPLALWMAVVWLRPGDLPLDRSTWWAVGAAAIGLAVGAAALASRFSVPSPGSALATVMAIGLVAPVVVGLFLGFGPIYPLEEVGDAARAFWVVVGASGAVACLAAVRPGVRH